MSFDVVPGTVQGIKAMPRSSHKLLLCFGLIVPGIFPMYLCSKSVQEPQLLIPVGLGMATIYASVLFVKIFQTISVKSFNKLLSIHPRSLYDQ
jgi:hypothetical protein